MSMETKFEFDKLNRVPKNSIKQAIQEYKEVFPNKALNRYVLCQIIAQNLEAKYLRPQLEEEISETEVELDDSKSKKNYNGQHILIGRAYKTEVNHRLMDLAIKY